MMFVKHEEETLEVGQVQDTFHSSCEMSKGNICEQMSESQEHHKVTNLVQGFVGGKMSCRDMSAVLGLHRH